MMARMTLGLRGAILLACVCGSNLVHAQSVCLLDNKRSETNRLADSLIAEGLQLQRLSPDQLVAHGRGETTATELWITPHIGHCRSDVAAAIAVHLKHAGGLLVVGEPPFQQLSMAWNGKWLNKDAYLQSRFPGTAVLEFSPEVVAQIRVDSQPNDAGNTVTLQQHTDSAETSQPARYLHAQIPKLVNWTTFATTSTAKKPAAALTTFWARGSSHTTQLALEWDETDHSRWIATIPLTQDWHYYVLQPRDFVFYTDPNGVGRGRGGDVLHTDRAQKVSFGLAQTHTKLDDGPHEFDLSDICMAPAPENHESLAVGEAPVIDGLSPMEMLYPLAPKYATIAESYAGTSAGALPLPASAWSSIWRPMGSGIGKARAQRFIPVVTVHNADGSRAGTLAAIYLDFAKPNAGSIYGYVSVSDDALLASKPWSKLVATMANRMQSGTFLKEAGSTEFTYDVRDLANGTFDIGATVLTAEGTSGTRDVHLQVFAEDRAVTESHWPCDGSTVHQLIAYDPITSAHMHVRAELHETGRLVDVIEQEIGFYDEAAAAPAYVTAHDRQFWRDGKPWRAFGINYMPSSGLSRSHGQEFEFWIEDAAYDPDIIEADLARIEQLGFNCISAFVYKRSLGRDNLLDLLRRARNHNLLVNLSLRPNSAPWAASDDVLTSLITTLRLAERDEIIAYDVAWEPWWGDQSRRKPHAPRWAAWVQRKYGSSQAAFAEWQFTPMNLEQFPTDEQLRKGGVWSRAVADYRAFVDEGLHASYAHARETIRQLDPNHLVSFRQTEGANPLVDPAAFPIDLRSVAEAVDFLSPEAYGVGDKPEKAATLAFAASYLQGLAPGKPILCAEYGQSVWSGTPFHTDPRLLQKQAQVYENVLSAAEAARFVGTISWWFPGGYRVNENSDYGVVNPDGTSRPVEQVIRKYAARVNDPMAPVVWKPTIRSPREQSARGYAGIYERAWSQFRQQMTSNSIPLLNTREAN